VVDAGQGPPSSEAMDTCFEEDPRHSSCGDRPVCAAFTVWQYGICAASHQLVRAVSAAARRSAR